MICGLSLHWIRSPVLKGDYMEILLIIVALWLINDAMNGYKAARHAQKVVYNRDLSFIDYMVMNHPIMTICIAILLLLAVIAIFI